MANKNKNNKNRNRNRRNGLNRALIENELAIMGMVWDTSMTTLELKTARDMARVQLPGMKLDGRIDTTVERVQARLVSEGVHPDDAIECLRMLAGTKQCMHWSNVPDFDSRTENQNEASTAKMYGPHFAKMNANSNKLRKELAAQNKKENESAGKWRNTF